MMLAASTSRSMTRMLLIALGALRYNQIALHISVIVAIMRLEPERRIELLTYSLRGI